MVGKRHRQANGHRHREHGPDDIETGRKPLAARFKDVANLAVSDNRRGDIKKSLKEGIDRDWLHKYRKDPEEIKQIKNKKVREFYEQQNERLNDWVEVDAIVMAISDDVLDSMDPDADHDGILERSGALQAYDENLDNLLPKDEIEKRKNAEWKAKWAININVAANVVLLAAKVVAALYSSSLSLIASLVDSGLDLLCTLIVWTTSRLVSWRVRSLERRFPVGRRRLEPLGILVFSIIMILSFCQILQESVTKLLPGGERVAAELPAIAVGAMLATIIMKGIIWFGCIPIKTTQVQALAQDCKTDVIFNTLSLLFPFVGYKLDIWWLDPAGAGLLSLFIIYDWAATSFENVIRLSGSSIALELERKLTFLAFRFSPVVDGFKSITAYHMGDNVWAEIDLLLDEKTPLNKAHDIAETLQYCCEGLKEVDRAFVTTDYTEEGPTGHASTN